MLQTWKYSLPAFLVPFAFVLSPNGEALLLQGSVGEVALGFAVSALAVVALAAATGQWMIGPARIPERVLAAVAALALLYLEPITIAIGLAALAAAVVVHLVGRRLGERRGWPRRRDAIRGARAPRSPRRPLAGRGGNGSERAAAQGADQRRRRVAARGVRGRLR